MSMNVKDGGSWRTVTGLHAKAGGTWRSCTAGYVKSGGVWRQFFGSGGTGITLSAPFNDISDASGGGATAGNTVTLTMASGKTISVSNPLVTGTLRYKLNAGAFTSCPDGTGIVVANGDTLQFDLSSGGLESYSITLSVSGVYLDDFLADCT